MLKVTFRNFFTKKLLNLTPPLTMVGGKYIVVPYAKVAYHVDGTVVWDVDHPKGN